MIRRRLALLVGVLLCLSLSALAQSPSDNTKLDAVLQQELTKMGQEDQLHRGRIMELLKQGQTPQGSKELSDLWEKQRAIDAANLQRLEEIIKEHGWPGESRVGSPASLAAFLILQHADPVTQEKYLPLLREAAAKKEIAGSSLAMLEDRVLMTQNKKQTYGSQLKVVKETGKMEVWPIEDEENVDARRASVGLEPLADYLKRFGVVYTTPKKN
jgi:hypothetical protein